VSGDGKGSPAAGAAGTPFDELARYAEIPRVNGLRLAPDGRRQVCVEQLKVS